jgi:hypothetical protein
MSGPGYYDDNFGHWDMEDEGDREFYRQVQAESVWKTCDMCDERVKLRPQYGTCNSCCERLERGEQW